MTKEKKVKKNVNAMVLRDQLETLRKQVNDDIDRIIQYINDYKVK